MRHSFGRAASTAIDLKDSKQVQAIIGTLTFSEAALVSEIDKTTKDIAIISLTSPALIPPHTPSQSPYLIQMGDDITLHTQCIAAIVGHFRWRKVTAIYEHSNGFSTDSGLITLLTDSLRVVNSEIEHHSSFPTLSSLSDPKCHH
ncbi:hypothetical protein L1049_025626 [Liquidambar formosana]|uniref:Receptor ligand binding region domain-containing protein n=1 Tax=Liquidambar formosana TaxID=63359 RepID=A0AAP0NC69_LIQFO